MIGAAPKRHTCRLVALLLLLAVGATTAAPSIKLATTTSTQNSGLLEVLLPPFQQRTGIEVKVIAVGTGKALRMGRDGDADVLMVHAERAEEAFVADGSGVDRHQFMYNDFVLVGPPDDPAAIAKASSVSEALRRIDAGSYRFVSRGDDSGTHKKELALWQRLGDRPTGKHYLEAGQGMGKVLQMASELGGYTLTDRGTWLAQKARLELQLLFAGDDDLNNPYGIIAVNPAKYPDIGYAESKQLIDWVCSTDGQAIIEGYRVNGEPLFIPLHPVCGD